MSSTSNRSDCSWGICKESFNDSYFTSDSRSCSTHHHEDSLSYLNWNQQRLHKVYCHSWQDQHYSRHLITFEVFYQNSDQLPSVVFLLQHFSPFCIAYGNFSGHSGWIYKENYWLLIISIVTLLTLLQSPTLAMDFQLQIQLKEYKCLSYVCLSVTTNVLRL